MKIFKHIIRVIFTFIILFSFSNMTHAAEDGIGFEIRPLFPSSQIDKEAGYYYIQTEPGQKQTFDMSILSTSDDDITLEFIIENAISSTNGNIGYSDDLKLIHESLLNPITEIVVPQKKEINLKAREETVASFDVTPPENSYEGVKMGRVIVRKKDDTTGKKGITQKYQYGVGIITSESGDSFNDGQTLDLGEVKATINNGNKVVAGTIVNPEPKTIENLQVRSYVTKKGENKKLKERNIDNFSFAPNSKVDYLIPWGLSNFETGDYTFYFEAKNEFDSFKLKKDFKIRGDEAKKLNNETAFKVGTPTYMKIILSVMNALLVLIFIIILMRNKKWEKELKNRKKKKNSKGKKARKK